jgi:hypothetical protein
VSSSDVLAQLQRWYSEQCDGEWEQSFGVVIESLDNPGWRVRVDVDGTPLRAQRRGWVIAVIDKHYAIARGMAGDWMGDSVPVRFGLSRGIPKALPKHGTAIYLSERANGRTAYVGQTRQTVAVRLAQHMRTWDRATLWAWVWVIPLLDETPDSELDYVEGRIGAWLRPVDCLRLPAAY